MKKIFSPVLKCVLPALIFPLFSCFGQSIVTVGNASLIDVVKREYQLTPNDYWKAGSIWYQAKIDLRQDFTIEGELNLGNRDAGADGIAFVLQPLSTNLGGAGVGIGYAGISPSVTVEIDTWQNCDPAEDHASIVLNGDVCHNASNTPVGPRIFSENIENGEWYHVIFKWTAASKTLQFFWDNDPVPFLSLTKDIVAEVFGGAFYVYPGFTSGTGAERNDHRVRVNDVSFTSEGLSADITHATCSNAADGAIDLTVTGMTAPLTYQWLHGPTTEDVTGLAPGIYKVTVTDARVPAVTLLGTYTINAAATATTWYKDADNDGYGDGSTQDACTQPPGYRAASALTALTGDCNDADGAINPGATEICNGKDDDCDGTTDEGCTSEPPTWYRDADRDGFGNANVTKQSFTQPKRYVSNALDCRDWDATVYPGAPELPDGIDNDCDGERDEGLDGRKIWYRDYDGDGYGRTTQTVWSVIKLPTYAALPGDCNDNDPAIYPGAPKVCNGKDNDCDGKRDEGCVPPEPDKAFAAQNLRAAELNATGLAIRAWPNPARDIIYLQMDGFEPGMPMEIILLSTEGKAVVTQRAPWLQKGQPVCLQVAHVPQGIFLLRVTQLQKVVTEKVMIIR